MLGGEHQAAETLCRGVRRTGRARRRRPAIRGRPRDAAGRHPTRGGEGRRRRGGRGGRCRSSSASVWSRCWGGSTVEAMFIATAMVATSVGITARVLADLDQLHSDEARIILGAAVIDDILGMIVLAVVSGIGQSGTRVRHGGRTDRSAGVGVHCLRRAGRSARGSPLEHPLRASAGPKRRRSSWRAGHARLAALSARHGLAAIIGAFLAGMVLAECGSSTSSSRPCSRSTSFWSRCSSSSPAVASTGACSSTAACSSIALDGDRPGDPRQADRMRPGRHRARAGARRRSSASAWSRGEVGLIVANVGRSLGAISTELFSTVVIMSVLTTLFVPTLLAVLFGRGARSQETPEDDIDYAVQDGRFPDL